MDNLSSLSKKTSSLLRAIFYFQRILYWFQNLKQHQDFYTSCFRCQKVYGKKHTRNYWMGISPNDVHVPEREGKPSEPYNLDPSTAGAEFIRFFT